MFVAHCLVAYKTGVVFVFSPLNFLIPITMSSDTLVSPVRSTAKVVELASSRLGTALGRLQDFYRDLIAMSPLEALGLIDEFRDQLVSTLLSLPKLFFC